MSDQTFDPDAELATTNEEMVEVAHARQQARLVAAYYTQLVAEGVPSDTAEGFTDAWVALHFDVSDFPFEDEDDDEGDF